MEQDQAQGLLYAGPSTLNSSVWSSWPRWGPLCIVYICVCVGVGSGVRADTMSLAHRSSD